MPDDKKPKPRTYLAGATGIGADPRVPSRTGASGLANWIMSTLTGYPLDPADTVGPVDVLMAAAPVVGKLKSLTALTKVAKTADVAEDAVQGIRAYHASPHDFERFDSSKIGTGEGAQAFGHGLYYAESEPVMEDYYRGFTQGKRRTEPVTYQGREFPPGTGPHRVLVDIAEQGKPATIEALKKDIRFNRDYAPEQAALKQHYLEFAEGVDPAHISVPKAHRYEVNIKADPAHFLDWDAPLSKQSPEVRERLEQAAASFAPDLLARWKQAGTWDQAPAGALYQGLGHEMQAQTNLPINQAKRAVSEKLKGAGLPGIKYLDAGSRGAPKYMGDPALIHAAQSFKDAGHSADDALAGLQQAYKKSYPSEIDTAMREVYGLSPRETRNYVAFDDQLIDILRKYGWLPPVAGMGYLSQVGEPRPRGPS